MAPKRKRASSSAKGPGAANAEETPAQAIAHQQPSSRDASEEDIADPVLQQVVANKEANSNTMSVGNENAAVAGEPASKRSRSGDASNSDDGVNGLLADKSAEEQSRILDALEHGEGGERGKLNLPEPPTELVHPVGYKTNPPPEGRPVRVYADGVFDLFHLGHMRQLQQAKNIFPNTYLIVGVTGDKETHRRKGLTVMSAAERAESVRHCKWVDEVVEDCPWIIADAPEFLEKYRIDYVAHDDIPYGADEGDDIYHGIKKEGKFLVTQRTEGVSTTGIITKIVKDYDKYIARQLMRGTSRQELNVSWLKKNELDIKRAVSELRENIKQNWTQTGSELSKDLRGLWQPSRPSSPAPSSRRGESGGSRATSPRSAAMGPPKLDVPLAKSPGGHAESSDFVRGYSLGLVGGVRSWMTKNRRTLGEQRGDSDSNDEGTPAHSPVERKRGRASVQDQVNAQIEKEAA